MAEDINRKDFYFAIQEILTNNYKGEFNRFLINHLSKDTKIEDDLGIIGDDADEFIYWVSVVFKVNTEGFTFGKYFGSENESFDLVTPILRHLFKENKHIPLEKSKRHALSLGAIEYCVSKGTLSDNIIIDYAQKSV
jgi:Protein of unknown function (DUF1493)